MLKTQNVPTTLNPSTYSKSLCNITIFHFRQEERLRETEYPDLQGRGSSESRQVSSCPQPQYSSLKAVFSV